MIFRDETAFTDAVIDLFRMSGWLVHHDRGDMKQRIQGDPGFPDLFAVHRKTSRAIAAELKLPQLRKRGGRGLYRMARMRKGQDEWLAALEGAVPTYLWTPEHWDEIMKIALAH